MRGPATPDQLTKLALLFTDHGLDKEHRADRIRLCSEHAGRPLTSSSQLSKAEAHTLIERLEGLPPGTDLLAAAERNKVAVAQSIVCTPKGKPTTDHDRAVVAEFAAQLEHARPAKTVKRHDPGCDGNGGHLIPAGVGIRHCRCHTVSDVPRARDASCPPNVCYCGGPGPNPLPGACAWWRPIPAPDFDGAINKTIRQELDRAARRRR